MSSLLQALLLQSGYNAALVSIGAALLGVAAGGVGTFIFLRKRSLVSDAIAHATLPGVGLAFILMVALGGDGRSLVGLMLGSALSAWTGLLLVEWITRRTRLSEDAAIGAVLSVFFGFGIVLLTVIQTLSTGRQAGLQSFLLGSTAGMLYQDAVVIAVAGAAAALAVFTLRRPMTLVGFDAEYAAAIGINVPRTDLAMMALALVVTVIGLKVVGLILIVAMLIIPPVTARFWTERSDHLTLIAAAVGGLSAYIGAGLSAAAPRIPTGPIIVLICFAMFTASLLLAPKRGVLASMLNYRRFQLRVHRRQGLIALGRGEPIFDRLTLAVLRRAGLIRHDGVATETGREEGARTLRDEARWHMVRLIHKDEAIAGRYDGLTPIEDVLTRDEIVEIDRQIAPPAGGTA
jgi:manganese/zinc/iron transport system permease protein